MEIDNPNDNNKKSQKKSKSKPKDKNKDKSKEKQKANSKKENPFTSKPTKNYKSTASDFKKPKTKSQLIFEESKELRLQRNLQMRSNKINDFLLRKRGIIDADGNTTIEYNNKNLSKNQSVTMSLKELSKIIDKTSYKIPPKNIAFIALNADANLDSLINLFGDVINNTSHKINDYSISYIIPQKIFKGKERLTLIKTERNIYSILDACKIADILIFVSSCVKCDFIKWQNDPHKYSNCIDEFGYSVLSMIKSQGITEHLCIVQDLASMPNKNRNDIKKLYFRFFESEVSPNKNFSFYNSKDKEETGLNNNDVDECKSIIRYCCALTPYASNLDLRKHRSYMMVQNIMKDKNGLYTELYGYIRGNTLQIGKYVHITGFGDYKVSDVTVYDDPLDVSTNRKNSSNKVENEQEMKDLTSTGKNNSETKDKNKSNKKQVNDDEVEAKLPMGNKVLPAKIGTAKPEQETNNKDDDDEIIDFDINLNNDDDDISFHSNDEEEDLDKEEAVKSKKHISKTALEYRTKEEMEFQDEVDTPIDIPAKERFKKYRGLASMKKGEWNPLENLPREYGNIYSFENIKNTFSSSVKSCHDDGLKLSGNYVKVSIMNFNFDNEIKYFKKDTCVVMSTLLDNERKLCVMHYKFSPYYDCDEAIIQNLNKKCIECHCGFRRYLIRPIFSTDLGSTNLNDEKVKFQKYLYKDKFYLCTVYSQLTFSNCPVLLFNYNGSQLNKVNYLGNGITLESDCKKIILKKIILTGYPVKIKKKKAVVRYMFFNPNDVNYFKPIQLTTKNGLRGNIKESVGTHGYMKCFFNGFVKSNDTICLNLYKRVFPVWFKETWRYKVYYGNREDYGEYFKYNDKEEDKDEKKEENQNKMEEE